MTDQDHNKTTDLVPVFCFFPATKVSDVPMSFAISHAHVLNKSVLVKNQYEIESMLKSFPLEICDALKKQYFLYWKCALSYCYW